MNVRAKIAGGSVVLKGQLVAELTPRSKGKQSLKIRLEKGNLKRLAAHWTAWPIRGGEATVLRLRLLVDPDIWWVRDATLTDYNLVNARRAIRGIRGMLETRKKGPPPHSNQAPKETFSGSDSTTGTSSKGRSDEAKATGGSLGSSDPK